MLTITVKLDEKRSTTSQYENRTAGVVLEASNLEIASPEDVLKKSAEMFALAQRAVDEQFNGGAKAATTPPVPSNGNGSNGNGHSQGNGHSGNGNGNGRSYGRPAQGSEPTPKQRQYLRKIAKDRDLGPQTIADICRKITGQDPRTLDKAGMSKLIEGLLADQPAAA
jgi:hypothetical protein